MLLLVENVPKEILSLISLADKVVGIVSFPIIVSHYDHKCPPCRFGKSFRMVVEINFFFNLVFKFMIGAFVC